MALLGLQPTPRGQGKSGFRSKTTNHGHPLWGCKTLDPWDFEKALPTLGPMVPETSHGPYC